MLNEKLLETGLTLDEIIILTLVYHEDFEKISTLFKYRESDYKQIISKLDEELYIKDNSGKITLREKAIKYFEIDDFDDFVDKFVNLFPKGAKNLSGQYIKCNKTDVENRLKKIIKKHKLDKDKVLIVTKAYVDEWADKNYAYAKASIYFIEKNGQSTLVDNYNNYTEELKGEIHKNHKILSFD